MPFTRHKFVSGLRLLLRHAAALVLAIAAPLVTCEFIEISCAHVCLAYFLGLTLPKAINAAGEKTVSKLIPSVSWGLLAIPALMTSAQAVRPVACFLAEYLSLNLAFRLPQLASPATCDDDGRQPAQAMAAIALLLHAEALLSCLFFRESPAANPPALLAGLLIPALLFAAHCFAGISPKKNAQATNDIPATEFASDIPGIKTLTARELSAIELTARGLTSKECAEKLGIKPSTVREYLRRAYGKLGISSSQDLKDLLAPKGPTQQTQPLSTEENDILQRVSFVLVPLSVSLAVAPLGFASERWGSGSTDILAMASGVLVGAAILSTGAAVHWQKKRPSTLGIASIALLSIILTCASFLSSNQTAAASLLRIAARFSLCTLLVASFLGTQKDGASPVGNVSKKCVAYSFVLGLAIEEIWRGSYWFSFMPATFFFILPANIAAIRTLHKRGSKQAIVGLASLAIGFVCCLITSRDLTMALVTFSLFMLVSPFVTFSLAGHLLTLGTSVAISLTAGLLAGVYAMNAFASVFTYHVGALGTFGTQTGVEVLSIAAATIVFLGTGISLLRDVTATLKQRRALGGDIPSTGEITQYLTAFNLTKTQIDVAAQLVQGKTVDEAAEALCYSPVTVRAARNRVFEALGVESIDTLSDSICAGIRRSQAD